MLIEQYDLEVFTPRCDPGAESLSATARLTVDISQIFPYLNAILPGAAYFPEAGALTCEKDNHSFAFHAYEISIGNVEDRAAAVRELDKMVSLINQTWERRAEITPSYRVPQRPTHMAVYRLLPQTNCRRCGEPTCYIFAAKLVAGQQDLLECLPLAEPKYAERLTVLKGIVIDAPSIGKRG